MRNAIPLVLALVLAALPACSNNPDYPVGKPVQAESLSSDTYSKWDENQHFSAHPTKGEPDPLPERKEIPESQVLAATVRVIAAGDAATGVVIAEKDGTAYILTAAHVIKNDHEVRMMTFTYPGNGEPAKEKQRFDSLQVVAVEPDQDLAVLKLEVGEGKNAIHLDRICLATKVPNEDFPARSVGCTNRENPTLRSEHVDRSPILIKTNDKRVQVWECRDATLPGRSGGPLVDSKGHLIGICSGAQSGKGYYIHLKEIISILQKADLGWISTARE